MTKKLIRRLAPTTAVVCLLVSCGPAPAEQVTQTEDEASISLRKAPTEALLLIDDSCSMNSPAAYLSCPRYESAVGGTYPPGVYSNMDVVKAGLYGCEASSEGFLWRWRPEKLAMMRLNSSASVQSPFDGSRAAHVSATLALVPTYGTPLTTALRDAGAYIGSYFDDFNVRPSTPFVVVVIADGQANGPPETYDFACGAPYQFVDGSNPVPGARYIAKNEIICALAGDQEVHVHTIAVGNGPPAFMQQMQDMAKAGGGSFATVGHPVELSNRLLDIMLNP
ncbi:MAG: hypothetical protein RIT81_34170 [Deltaproteobacteria bacterium]